MLVLDSGYLNQKLGEPFHARGWTDYGPLLAEVDEDIPLGLAIDSYQAVESHKKIRSILRGGRLIPGHERRIFDEPEKLGFRRVSAHAVARME